MTCGDNRPTPSYAQNAEDIRLWRVLRDVENGFYVDVGAGHPVIDSVTHLFYEHGWSGINIEPSPLFEELARARTRDINLNVAVGAREGTVQLFVTYPEPTLSTVHPLVLESSQDHVERVIAVEVPQRRLDTILAEHAQGRVIHFLKVDVEGAEYDVLDSCDWATFRPWVVLVEATRPNTREPTHHEWEPLLLKHGYVFAAFDGLNRFYVSEEHEALREALAYPVCSLDAFVPQQQRLAQERLEAAESEFAADVRYLRATIEQLEAQMRGLQARLVAETARAATAEARLRALSRSLSYRAALKAYRALRPVRPILIRFRRVASRAMKAERALRSRLNRLAIPARRARILANYRTAVSTRGPWIWPERPQRINPPDGRLSALEELLEDPNTSPKLLDDAILAVRRDMRAEGLHADGLKAHSTGTRVVVQAEIARTCRDLILAARPAPAEAHRDGRRSLVVDARSLQLPANGKRGIGRHALQTLRICAEHFRDTREIVFLTDPGLDPLSPDVAALSDRIIAAIPPDEVHRIDVLFQPSPMTHNPGPLLPILLASPAPYRIAVVYDFIPAHFPGSYLRSSEARIEYLARLEALKRYDYFLPISNLTARDLRRFLRRDARATVTGVANPLAGVAPTAPESPLPDRYVLAVPSAPDPRKNLLAAIGAVASSPTARRRREALVVVGSFPQPLQRAVISFAAECGLPKSRLVFLQDLSDSELAWLYEHADATVVPSFAEGLSLPIIEAISAGSPVVASDIDAHAELIGDGWWLAPPEDPVALGRALERALRDRDLLLERQRDAIGNRFSPSEVARRIRAAFSEADRHDETAAPRAARKSASPRVAMVSPLPPVDTSLAGYAAALATSLSRYVDVTVFSDDTAVPGALPGVKVRPYGLSPLLAGAFHAILWVLGDGPDHLPVASYFRELGGPCIAEGTRIEELWRACAPQEHGSEDRRHTAYREIAEKAAPLFVRSTRLAASIESDTGVRPVSLSPVPALLPPLTVPARAVRDARARLGWSEAARHLVTRATSGLSEQAMDIVIDALAFLSRWGMPCHLHCVGLADPKAREMLLQRAARLGIASHVHLAGWISSSEWRLLLLAADAGAELATHPLFVSSAVADFTAFGVPTVASSPLLEDLTPPDYVVGVPERFSALLVAEALEQAMDVPRTVKAPLIDDSRRAWLSTHTPDAHSRRILEVLGLPARPR
jgi:FkbM family methyltransferase